MAVVEDRGHGPCYQEAIASVLETACVSTKRVATSVCGAHVAVRGFRFPKLTQSGARRRRLVRGQPGHPVRHPRGVRGLLDPLREAVRRGQDRRALRGRLETGGGRQARPPQVQRARAPRRHRGCPGAPRCGPQGARSSGDRRGSEHRRDQLEHRHHARRVAPVRPGHRHRREHLHAGRRSGPRRDARRGRAGEDRRVGAESQWSSTPSRASRGSSWASSRGRSCTTRPGTTAPRRTSSTSAAAARSFPVWPTPSRKPRRRPCGHGARSTA